MCKRNFILSAIGAIALLCSCVDNNYDVVNKEISTDVKLEGNRIALPFGNLKPVVLDSLVNVDSIDILKKGDDGVYSISMDSSISINENVESITLNIDPIRHHVPIEFEKVNIETVHIAGSTLKSVEFAPPTISLEKLNEELRNVDLTDETKVGFEITESTWDMLDRLGSVEINLTETVSTGKQTVACDFDYEFPKEVESLRSVKLGTKDDKQGSLVTVVVTHPVALDGVNRSLDFSIDFPEMFRLAKSDNADHVEQYVFGEHSIRVSGLEPEDATTTTISFYISELIIDESMISENAGKKRLDVSEQIEYNIDYNVNGKVKLTSGMSNDDLSYKVNFGVDLSFFDAAGVVKDIEVPFSEDAKMHFEGHFGDLEHIDTIKYIVFDEERSHIEFDMSMPEKEWLNAFELKEGYRLKIAFPKELDICPDHSRYEGVYDADEHAFYVRDLNRLTEAHWDLVLKQITLNKVVENEQCDIDFNANISFVDGDGNNVSAFMLEGRELESMVQILDEFGGAKEAEFIMDESDLVIKDAVVHTTVVTSSLDTKAEFKLNEEIPAEIARIDSIGFAQDVEIVLDLTVVGMDELDTELEFDVDMKLPPFLKLKRQNNNHNVTISEGNLKISTKHNPSTGKPLTIKLWCSGLVNDGLTIKESTDGKSYITYDDEIVVEGEARVRGADFHSHLLENDIAFDVEFSIGEIEVNTFHGLYCADIESVEEAIALDLGDDLAFLKEEGNSILLAEPQLEFVIKNSIGIPVDVDLYVAGKDKDGNVIQTSVIAKDNISILPAEYNEKTGELVPVETKLFITNDINNVNKQGYQNIQVENLANLLEQIPDSILFNVVPKINTSSTHHVNIGQPISLDAAYSVFIPLKFTNFNMCYNDTIPDLNEGLGETLSMFSNISLKAKMDIINTIPLGLTLKVTPLDVNDNVLEDFTISDLVINAGLGGHIVDENGVISEQPAQSVEFAIESKSGNLSALDKLALSIKAATDHTSGGIAINAEQGIRIENIVFEVLGDIEIDLNK